ncbi:hypothetical protein [Amnibacterium endophyticum]|uniref:Uncharacterized protein n=1 Tax=Amnibacterium endophyticum TaxID=2109337 RepID=A0ABW4LH87_9MICO
MSQRDPTLYAAMAVLGGLQVVSGVLNGLAHLDEPWGVALGAATTAIGIALLVLGIRRYRREKARTD